VLFTGSGRHRRQTQAEKAIAAAGVAGVGLALPLLAVTSAHAAPVHTWEKVADCESGGDWGHNAGNDLYGGLQLSPATWAAFGGAEFAPRADLATKSQQITVAERVLAANGTDAFAPCSLDAGLSQGGVPGEVDTNDPASEAGSLKGNKGLGSVKAAPYGSTTPATAAPQTPDAAQPSAPTAEATPAAPAPSAAETQPAAPATTATPSAELPQPAVTGLPADPTGSPYGTVDASGLPATSPATPDTAQPGAAQPGAAQPGAAQSLPEQAAQPYTVIPGDTLSAIAASHAVPGGWPTLYQDNRGVVGGNPDLIVPGQQLKLH